MPTSRAPDSTRKCHMGSPASIPLAEPEQCRDQAPDPSPPGLPLAVPQGMSCPLPAAHPGSEDATAAAYLSLAANSCSLQFEVMHQCGEEYDPNSLLSRQKKKNKTEIRVGRQTITLSALALVWMTGRICAMAESSS